MPTFVMLTRISSDAAPSPQSLENLEQEVAGQIRSQCPDVEWVHNYALLGGYDYLDIFNAPDLDTALRVSTIVRTYGSSSTEVWAATEWAKFKDLIQNMPHAA